jgi:hypothetical protein
MKNKLIFSLWNSMSSSTKKEKKYKNVIKVILITGILFSGNFISVAATKKRITQQKKAVTKRRGTGAVGRKKTVQLEPVLTEVTTKPIVNDEWWKGLLFRLEILSPTIALDTIGRIRQSLSLTDEQTRWLNEIEKNKKLLEACSP